MIISDNKTIAQIQQEFSQLYAGLKIEFYRTGHGTYKASSPTEMIEPNTRIGDVRTSHQTEDLKISPELTVAQVEQSLEKQFGLNAQVFRKSKDIWLQTSTTDDWTLEKQNGKGIRSMNSNVGLYQKN